MSTEFVLLSQYYNVYNFDSSKYLYIPTVCEHA